MNGNFDILWHWSTSQSEPGHGADEEEVCSLMLIDNRINQVNDVWRKTELSKPNSTALSDIFKDGSKKQMKLIQVPGTPHYQPWNKN